MRYRKLTATGDRVFGHGATADFLVNSPATVAQAVQTALKLFQGEWFLNTSTGLALSQILGYGTQALYDSAIKSLILSVQGVFQIQQYNSSLDHTRRKLTVTVTLNTIFGAAFLSTTIGVSGGYGAGPYGAGGYGN